MAPFPTSRRGQDNVKPDLMIDLSRRVAEDAYDEKSNPGGIVDMGSAVNQLMLDDLLKWQKKHETPHDRRRYLTYNDTQCGPDLPRAAATFMNHFFHPTARLQPDNLLAANGLPALLDTLFFNLADPGAAILVPSPGYGHFAHAAAARAGLHVVPVPCDDVTLARFRQHVRPGRPAPELLRRLDAAAEHQRRALGRRIAAVAVANPEDPLACGYTAEMLRWLVRWCEAEGAHLIVDEACALGGGSGFRSVLSLPLGDMVGNVHVLWGMSKDFGLGGCHVGFLATYNKHLYQAMRTCSMFTWVSAFGGIVSTKLLSDIEYVSDTYLPKYHKLLGERRECLSSVLATHQIPYTAPDAAFFMFIDLSRWLSNFEGDDGHREMALLEHLLEAGVFLEPGRALMSTLPGHFRLNYGACDALFHLGLKRMISALDRLDDGKVGGEKQHSLIESAERRRGAWRKLLPCLT